MEFTTKELETIKEVFNVIGTLDNKLSDASESIWNKLDDNGVKDTDEFNLEEKTDKMLNDLEINKSVVKKLKKMIKDIESVG